MHSIERGGRVLVESVMSWRVIRRGRAISPGAFVSAPSTTVIQPDAPDGGKGGILA